MICLMDSMFTAQDREAEFIREGLLAQLEQAYKNGEEATAKEVIKWKSRVDSSKEVVDSMNKDMERLRNEIKLQQETIDEQEKEIVKLCEPPDMHALGKAIRELSNYLDDS